MKRIFLLIVVPALLVALGFAQTPVVGGNTDQVNIRGCLGASDGSYTVAEDNTGKVFKITTSSGDLKAYVGQDVNFIGHKAGTAENSLAVTEFHMISEHCAAAAAAPAASVSTPAETISTPPEAAAAAAPAAPDATVSTPTETVSTPPAAAAAPAAAAPDATVSTPPETVSTPPAPAAAPAGAAPVATVIVPAETASAPAVAAPVHKTRAAARPEKPATPVDAAKTVEPVSTPVADAPVPIPTASAGASSETASTPAAVAPVPKAPTGRSTLMLASIVVVVVLIGLMVPLFQRWRRRKLLEETRGQNLSFTKEAKSDPGKSDTSGGRKAA